MMLSLSTIKVMVVDDDPDIPSVFSMCLDDRYQVTGFASGKEAISAAKETCFPIAILDLKMEGLSGIEVMKRLREICTRQQIIIFTGFASTESAIESLNLGAFQYLQKPFRIATMRTIVARAADRYRRETSHAAEGSVEYLQSLGMRTREIDVVQEIMDGKSASEIAQKFFISRRTVETHVQNIFSRLKVSSKVALIAKLRDPRKDFTSGGS